MNILKPFLWSIWFLNSFTASVLDGVLYGDSNFWVCGRNPLIWLFKWKLFSSTFTRYYLFFKLLKNEIGNLVEICLWLHLAVKGLKYRRKKLATCPVPDLLIVYTWQHWNLNPNKSCIIKTAKILTATPLNKYLRTVKRACVVLKHLNQEQTWQLSVV